MMPKGKGGTPIRPKPPKVEPQLGSRQASQKGSNPAWYNPGQRPQSGRSADYSNVPLTNENSDWANMKQRYAGQKAASLMPVAPTSDMTLEDMISTLGGGGSESSGAGSGGGYGAVAKNPDPLGWNAIAQVQALEGGYRNMLDALRASQQAQLGSFDRATSAVNAGSEAARARQAQIVADLSRMSGEAAGRVGDVYSGAGRTIQDLMGQYAQLAAGQNEAAGRTLQVFGANPQMAVPGGSSTSDFLAASAANVARGGAALQAQLAGRGDVYGALGNDFAQRSEAWTQQQLAQLLAERQQAEASAAREQAQLALDLELKKLALQQQEQARAAQYA